MGSAKRLLEEIEGYRERALEILKEVKAIEYCACGRVYRVGKNYDNAYPYATKLLKERYGNEQDFKLFQEQIKKVLDEAPCTNPCPNCESDD